MQKLVAEARLELGLATDKFSGAIEVVCGLRATGGAVKKPMTTPKIIAPRRTEAKDLVACNAEKLYTTAPQQGEFVVNVVPNWPKARILPYQQQHKGAGSAIGPSWDSCILTTLSSSAIA